ncbi:MAG: hypothetical protein NTY19_23955 [Planctomycetota bacterium]|nr:hypothetical protein [Planctomycetota bacterium]
MPITPFHFGPGAAVHAIAPRHISFLAFCAANVLIDVETLYYMLTHQYPWHRFFHTYVGATIIVVATVLLFAALLKLASGTSLPNLLGWKQLTIRPVVLGAAVGGYSHIVLDSLMHPDIHPLSPFSAANALAGVVSLGTLHWACVALGVVGIVIIGVRTVLHSEAGT